MFNACRVTNAIKTGRDIEEFLSRVSLRRYMDFNDPRAISEVLKGDLYGYADFFEKSMETFALFYIKAAKALGIEAPGADKDNLISGYIALRAASSNDEVMKKLLMDSDAVAFLHQFYEESNEEEDGEAEAKTDADLAIEIQGDLELYNLWKPVNAYAIQYGDVPTVSLAISIVKSLVLRNEIARELGSVAQPAFA